MLEELLSRLATFRELTSELIASQGLVLAAASLGIAVGLVFLLHRGSRWHGRSKSKWRRRRFRVIRNEPSPWKPTASSPPKRKPDFKSNLARRDLFNESEKRFYQVLVTALPDHHIFPQVSFNALVTHARWIRMHYWQVIVRGHFNTKYVDYVVCRRSDLKPVAVVEYDGQGHFDRDDELRDEMLMSVGYLVFRFSAQDTLDTVKERFSFVGGLL